MRGGPAGSEKAAKRCTEMIRTVGPTLNKWLNPDLRQAFELFGIGITGFSSRGS